jgi:enoyl-[acyl-carrier protein] reductase I
MSKLLEGKQALILGIANRWSLAYAIAQAFSREGAGLVLTYLNDRFKPALEELSEGLNVRRLLPCDVTKEEELAQLSAELTGMGQLDAVVHSLAFANREDLSRPFVETQPRRIPAGAGGERLFAGGCGARGGAGHDRRRLHHDAHLPRLDAGGSELQCDGRGQSVAGGRHTLPGERSGTKEDPRQRHIRRAREDSLCARRQDFSTILDVVAARSRPRHIIPASEVADTAVFLASDTDAVGRSRLPVRAPRAYGLWACKPTIRSGPRP